MSLWMENLNELKHYHDLLHEAEQDRLARQALAGRPKSQDAWCKALGWLGSRLSAWGKQLQEHYGTAVANTPLVQRHSD